MGNTSKEPSEHDYDRKYWIQAIVNDSKLCKRLNKEINGLENLCWIGLLSNEDYAEYKLNQQVMPDNLGIIYKEITRKDIWVLVNTAVAVEWNCGQWWQYGI